MLTKLRKVTPLLLLCFTLAIARTIPTATILPFGGGKNDKDAKRSPRTSPPSSAAEQEDSRKRPPPPPPPRGADPVQHTDESTTGSNEAYLAHSDHPSQFGTSRPFEAPGGHPPPPPGWFGPPQHWNHHSPSEWQQPSIHQELEAFIAREAALLAELQNVTSKMASYEQRDDLHMRQLDVLTERVMDAEAAAASERNLLVECQANCTELGRTIAQMQDQMEEWSIRCQNLTLQHEEDTERLTNMKVELKERNREVEDLATMIETARLDTERERHLVERNSRKKKRGFFAWLFGIHSREEEDEDKLQNAQEFARSTLLRALQTERDSVHELENALSTLQQNNSAISEMVQSRDMLIDELNNRVAVFEEDKLVLKAALRQLQKEMKEEGPKTQKVIDDLKEAREGMERLKAELDAVNAEHQAEVSMLQSIISQKQASINSSESNMTVIGSYVDKLEERLATFALARRDIDVREQKCQEIEDRAIALEKECGNLREQIKGYEIEHDDLKSLLGDLVSERAELQRENAALQNEKRSLVAEGSMLRDTISSLEIDVDSLGKYVSEWKARVSDLEATIARQSNELLERGGEQEFAGALEHEASDLEQQQSQMVIPPVEAEEPELLSINSEGHKASTLNQLVDKVNDEDEHITLQPFVHDDIPPPPPPPPVVESETDLVEDLSLEPNGNMDYPPFASTDGQHSYEQGPADPVHGLSNPGAETLDDSERFETSFPEHDAHPMQRWGAQEPSDVPVNSDLVANSPFDPPDEDDVQRQREQAPSTQIDSESISELQSSESQPELKDSDDPEISESIADTTNESDLTMNPDLQDTDNTILGSVPKPRHKVPFRAIRKAFARTTGIHGLITPPSRSRPET